MVWSSYSAVSKGILGKKIEEGKIRYVCLCIAPKTGSKL